MGYAQLVIDPAGSGKSTYCSSLYQHCEATRRKVHIVNLDPAAENFNYPVSMDIRELISLDDVMEELGLGPNGILLYCMEHLEENLDDWLTEELENWTQVGKSGFSPYLSGHNHEEAPHQIFLIPFV